MPDGTTAPIDPKPAAAVSGRDPIHDLITRLDRDASTVAAKDPDLSRLIHQLADTATKRPERVEDAAFRTRVAYALQDMEKLAGPISSVPQGLREEMSRLAMTAPGLQNDRLQEMMRATPSMDDARLVRDVRSLAFDVGGRSSNQNAPDVRGHIDALENRIRLAPSASSSAGPVTPTAVEPRAASRQDRVVQPGVLLQTLDRDAVAVDRRRFQAAIANRPATKAVCACMSRAPIS